MVSAGSRCDSKAAKSRSNRTASSKTRSPPGALAAKASTAAGKQSEKVRRPAASLDDVFLPRARSWSRDGAPSNVVSKESTRCKPTKAAASLDDVFLPEESKEVCMRVPAMKNNSPVISPRTAKFWERQLALCTGVKAAECSHLGEEVRAALSLRKTLMQTCRKEEVDQPLQATAAEQREEGSSSTQATPAKDPSVYLQSRFTRVKVEPPTIPLEALTRSDEDVSGKTPKTPGLTPNTLTDNALKRSEMLLAELSALGLADEDFCLERDPESDLSLSKEADAILMKAALSPRSGSPSLKYSQHKQLDTVEVPVVLLDLFSETWSRYHSLQASLASSKPESLGENKLLELTTQEPEPEVFSSKASSTCMDESSISGCTTPPTSVPASLSFTATSISPCSPPCCCNASSLSPRVLEHAAPVKVKSVVAPVHDGSARPFARTSFQVQQQASPRLQRSAVQTPRVTVETSVTCSIQQTVTITNTVTLHP